MIQHNKMFFKKWTKKIAKIDFDLKLVFSSSLLDAQHSRDCGENKPAILLYAVGKVTQRYSPILRWYTSGRQLQSKLAHRTDRFLVIG